MHPQALLQKRSIFSTHAFFHRSSVPCANVNDYCKSVNKAVPRRMEACAICAMKDWIERRTQLYISLQKPMAADLSSFGESTNKCTKKPRSQMTLAARHRLPQPNPTTRRTTACASRSRTRWTRSLEYSTTSRHGRRYPSKNCMLPVCNIRIIRACAGCYTHVGCPNTLFSPTALLRRMKLKDCTKPSAACRHP